MTSDDIQNLKDLLHRMQTEDPNCRVFGSTFHKYRLGPTLSENELRAFEQDFQVTLSADYRLFLKEAGNGGANFSSAPYIAVNAGPGPGYGLLPLNEAVAGCDLCKPFPLIPSNHGQPVQGKEGWGDEEPYPGVLEISYSGCAFFSYLVVNGPTYGTVWDADIEGPTFYPTNLSFDAWYRRWMDWLAIKIYPSGFVSVWSNS